VAAEWQERARRAAEGRARLEKLEQDAEARRLTDDEAWRRAHLTLELGGRAEAIPLLRQVLAGRPDHAGANYLLGRALLDEGDAAGGTACLEKAMEQDPECILPACTALYRHLKEGGQEAEAQRYRDRAVTRYELLQSAREERSNITPKDPFEPHALPDEAVARLREQLAAIEKLAAAYLVRKTLRVAPEPPLFVLGARPAVKWYQTSVDGEALRRRLLAEVQWPGETAVLVLIEEGAPFRRALARVGGSEIYRRGK
jgi:tetratricopeptide (TPR) repeat protein